MNDTLVDVQYFYRSLDKVSSDGVGGGGWVRIAAIMHGYSETLFEQKKIDESPHFIICSS